MSKVVSFIILGGLVLAAAATVNFIGVDARQETKFVPISVLAKNQANYGVDEGLGTIPAVSIDILEDKVHDLQQKSSVPIIRYTSLPTRDLGIEGQENDNTQTIDKVETNDESDSTISSDTGQNDPGVNNGMNNKNKNRNKDKNKDRNKERIHAIDKTSGAEVKVK